MKPLVKSGFLPVGINRVVIIILVTTMIIVACFSIQNEEHYMKDLNENMLDLSAYHDNLGGYLIQINLNIAE